MGAHTCTHQDKIAIQASSTHFLRNRCFSQILLEKRKVKILLNSFYDAGINLTLKPDKDNMGKKSTGQSNSWDHMKHPNKILVK